MTTSTLSSKTKDIIDTKGSIVNSLILNNPGVCSEFKKTIIIGSELGSGVQGTIHDVDISRNPNLQNNISIPGFNNTDYIIKTILKPEVRSRNLSTPKTVEHAIRDIMKRRPQLVYDVQLAYNGGDPNRITQTIKIVNEATDCLLQESYTFPKNDESGQNMIIEPGNYICNTSSYSEYMIGVLCSTLSEYMNSDSGFGCRNFVYITDFATCTSSDNFLQYIFMEKIDMDLYTLLNKPYYQDDIDTPSILFQCLFAIYTYEFIYQMNHNDLHVKNVFIRELPTTKYLLYEYKHIQYYIPCKYIVKIGDYGTSCKYSDPMILNENVLIGEFSAMTPNFYNTTYDIMCLLLTMSQQSLFIRTILQDNNVSEDELNASNLLQIRWLRPKIDKLGTFNHMNAEQLLSRYYTHSSMLTIRPHNIIDDDIIYMGRII